jgi:hypothetical protein
MHQEIVVLRQTPWMAGPLLSPVRNDSKTAGKTPATPAGLGVSRHAGNFVGAPASATG